MPCGIRKTIFLSQYAKVQFPLNDPTLLVVEPKIDWGSCCLATKQYRCLTSRIHHQIVGRTVNKFRILRHTIQSRQMGHKHHKRAKTDGHMWQHIPTAAPNRPKNQNGINHRQRGQKIEK